MRISLIVAVSRNGVIGVDNALPWYLPEDLKHFKSITMAKPIIMGRKTFDSIGRPLPGRTNIVLSRDTEFNSEGVEVAATLEQALSIARPACLESNVEEIMIIGGEQIYRMTIQVADRLYLTEVDIDIHGDAFFPEIDYSLWREEIVEYPKVTAKYPYKFVTLDRK